MKTRLPNPHELDYGFHWQLSQDIVDDVVREIGLDAGTTTLAFGFL
jgi:hypothetical protein